jgi:dihydroorotate dehydrogenase
MELAAMNAKVSIVDDIQEEVNDLRSMLKKSEKVRADQIVLINSLVDENAILTQANMTLL